MTLRETNIVLRGLTIDKKPLKDHLQAVGHKDAFYYIVDLAKEKTLLTEFVIKQIHALVLADKPYDKGVYRKILIKIIGSVNDIVQPYLIEPQMNELINEYKNDKRDIVTKLSKLHVKFEGIHPFIDGNVRTGRLIVNLELMKLGYPPIDIKYKDRARYYKAFDSYYSKHDIEPMKKLFAEYINNRLDEYLKMLLNN